MLFHVPGGRIDHAHHDSYARLALDETVEYAKAVKKARALTDESDTLIVVSSDHAHTMTVAGYPSRGNDILGAVDTAKGFDDKPYTTISYANGKAPSIAADGRVDVTLQDRFINGKNQFLSAITNWFKILQKLLNLQTCMHILTILIYLYSNIKTCDRFIIVLKSLLLNSYRRFGLFLSKLGAARLGDSRR